jgi:hypothetical protein
MAARSLNSSLQSLVGEGWIDPVHCAGREILRRIFVTVRDRHWQEVRATRFDAEYDRSGRTVRLSARHTSELVDFEWSGELTVNEDCSDLRFGFEGRALRDMEVCRLGLIVLHPVESMVGSRLRTFGEEQEQCLTIGQLLAPQPIVGGIPGAMTEPFKQLTIEREDFGQLQLLFTGDSFELEDQRNWGDASFKTYCTPLRKGFPRVVKSGTSVAHSVEVRFAPARAASVDKITTIGGRPARVSLPAHLPALGRVMPAEAARDERTNSDAWSHLHVDLTGQDAAAVRRMLENSSGSQLEIALDGEATDSVERTSLLLAHRARIARVLVYGSGSSLPGAEAIRRWRRALQSSTEASVPVYAGTRGYFVEFNRSAPWVAPADGVAFPLTGTVHSDDTETLLSNVATVREMVVTARQLTDVDQFALAPLALYHPPARRPTVLSRDAALEWLAATLRHAIAVGVTSITLADDLVSAIGPIVEGSPQELLMRLTDLPRHSSTA